MSPDQAIGLRPFQLEVKRSLECLSDSEQYRGEKSNAGKINKCIPKNRWVSHREGEIAQEEC